MTWLAGICVRPMDRPVLEEDGEAAAWGGERKNNLLINNHMSLVLEKNSWSV